MDQLSIPIAMDSPQNFHEKEKSRITRSNSMASLQVAKDSLTMAVPVSIRGRRLRQILRVLPIDVMEVQMLAREFFCRCDLQEIYMSLDKCAETFGITAKIARGIYAYIRMNEALDDASFNHARKLQLQYPSGGRSSVIEDLVEWSRVYGQQSSSDVQGQRQNQSIVRLPSVFLTFENFVEASVYVSPRGSIQQRIDLAFSILDANCDGFVDASEIRSIMIDSLRANLTNHKGDSSKKVVQILENEVEELIDDLRAQYRAEEFTKDQFIEFAESAEFLNFFTVNKHWLRDILGDNHNKQARPQDAEMRQFLESLRDDCMCELDSEDIIDLQETLRDHLIDTVDDLRAIKSKDFLKMNINRKTARVIRSGLHNLNAELEESDLLRIPSVLPGASPVGTPKRGAPSYRGLIMESKPTLCEIIGRAVYKVLPTTSHSVYYGVLSIYILQTLISYFICRHKATTKVIGTVSGHGIFLCILMAPFCRYYPILTKWMSVAPNTVIAEIVLFITSMQFARINTYFAICHSVAHSVSYQLSRSMAAIMASSSDAVDWQTPTGWMLLVLGLVLLIDWWRVMNPFQFVHQLKSIVLRVVVIAVLTAHFALDLSSSTSFSFDIIRAVPLLIALVPTVIMIGTIAHERVSNVRLMEVELVKNERPNYMLLWLKRGSFHHKCGQYVQLNYPSVSKHEYHPFYITSSPDSNFMRISMQSCGDWTQKLFDIHMQQLELDDVNVMGPFGCGFSSNKLDYNYDYLMVIAAGEGSVEVISSFLDFCCTNLLTSKSNPVSRVYCYWMVSADDGCYWFYKLLRDLRNMHKDKFFPTIFVTSSHESSKVSAFGLNFFLALRRESLQANVVARRTMHRLSTEKVESFRGRKKSVFVPMRDFQRNAARRKSRFHGGASNLLSADDDSSSSHLLATVELAEHQCQSSPGDSIGFNGRGGAKNHGFNLKFESQVGGDTDDIAMQSPDFRNAFSRIRDQLINNNGKYTVSKSVVNQGAYNVQKQSSMNAIVPALTLNSNAARQFNVGTFFVGSEILASRLALFCQQFSDDQVEFEFNPMVIGKNYSNKYSQ